MVDLYFCFLPDVPVMRVTPAETVRANTSLVIPVLASMAASVGRSTKTLTAAIVLLVSALTLHNLRIRSFWFYSLVFDLSEY